MVGKAVVTCIEEVKYTNKNNEVKEGVIVHCIQPDFTEEREKIVIDLFDNDKPECLKAWLCNAKVSRCWVSLGNLTQKKMQGLAVHCEVMIRAGKYGEYIDYVL